MDLNLSMIRPMGYCNSRSCGYCHGKVRDGNTADRFSYYANTKDIDASLYKNLLDRCWRRSGTLLYRPNQRSSCCPHYTIRLDAMAFKPTKDQRQTVNRFNRYVIGDSYANEAARHSPRSKKEAKRRETTFDLAERIHEAESSLLNPLSHVAEKKGRGATVQPAHRFEVTLEPDTFTEEKFLLFENYQKTVHKEPPSKIRRDSFESFLCSSPVRRETVTIEGCERQLGSFHQCYRLDGRLVAVGVLDLLPECVSAVYFMYHASIHRHSPGKLGALREIALAVEGGYRWWYSGFYIHSCPKMRYKIDFAPQYVLDPNTLDWHLLDKEALAIFDLKPYVSLSEERKVVAVQGNPDGDIQPGNQDDSRVDGLANGHGGHEERGETSSWLINSNMPSLPSRGEIAQYDLDGTRIAVPQSQKMGLLPVSMLVVWPEGNTLDGDSFKGKVAELAAMVGVDLMPQVCLDFR